MVDIAQLENALLNLAINARDAMPDGGKLTIETANQVLDEAYTARHQDREPGAYVMITVSDSGKGMPEHVRARVFESFFTTKDVGKGTGLGLSMVFGFAKQSGGHISIFSEEGKGTAVRIYLPKAKETTNDESATEESEKDTPKGNETIFVVEDHEDMRASLVKALGRLGYAVLEAEDGPAALEVMATSGAIDLLLADVILPRGMSGRDVATAFRKRYPTAGVLYLSGYTRDFLNNRGQLEEGVAFMNKPYEFQAMAGRVREILDGRKAREK